MENIIDLNEKDVKRYLTVRKRIIFEQAIYHVTQRAPGKERLFLEESDNLYFLKILKDINKKYRIKVFSFSLMPNHIHLLIQITEKNLTQALKNLFERYANYFNYKYQRKGHVFCGRFRAALCNDDMYFLAISIYIHLNPFNAALCDDPRDYRWSSIKLYEKNGPAGFVDSQKVLSIIDKDIERAQQQYLKILTAGMRCDKSTHLFDSLSIKCTVREYVRCAKKVLGIDKKRDPEFLINQIKTKEETMGIKDHVARKYFIEQLLADGYLFKEIEEIFGISRATLYRLRLKK
jgi:putative transposase